MTLTLSGPVEPDKGTGEHSHATDPIITAADSVEAGPVKGADELPAETVFTADNIDNQPVKGAVGGTTESDPVEIGTDFPVKEAKPEKVVKATKKS